MSENLGEPHRYVIVGCGHAAVNTVNRLYLRKISAAVIIAIHADKQHLDMIHADTRILMGKSLAQGIGHRVDHDMGKRAAEKGRPVLERIFEPGDLVFIITGLDDGIGTGSTPVIVQIAKNMGATVVGVISFIDDRKHPTSQQWECINQIAEISDYFIPLNRNQLLNNYPERKSNDGYQIGDLIISDSMKCIIDSITLPSLIPVQYSDFVSILGFRGFNRIQLSEGSNQVDAETLVKNCLFPDSDPNVCTCISSTLLYIIGGQDLTLTYCQKIISLFIHELNPQTPVISGACIQEDMEGKVRLLAIMQITYPDPPDTGYLI
ncbi:MAG TPA: cell division protein FtsZ [Methanospirillum sp.]|nr:cell division protein FtsZ [Methanospirillum sp.]